MSAPPTTVPDALSVQRESPTCDLPAQPECPICSRPIANDHKCKTLYGVKVCKKCRIRLAHRRQEAFIIDALLFWLLSIGVNSVLALLLAASDQDLLLLVYLLVNWGLLNLVWLGKDCFVGQSPGKAIAGVQVIDVTSREPTGFGRSIMRNLPLLIPRLGALVILITMMKGQRWADRWANTMVIDKKHRYRVPYAPPGAYCRSCGYDLTGNVSGRCPECGVEIPPYWLVNAEPAGSRFGV